MLIILRPGKMRGYLLIPFIYALCLLACDHQKRDPVVQLSAVNPEDKAWFHGTREEREYLLEALTTNSTREINWPPENLARIVDISVDVTGSGFRQFVLFEGQTMPMAEYNLRKFHRALIEQNILRPGDHVLVRLFGAQPQGKDIKVDEYTQYIVPPIKLTLRTTILSRRHDDRDVFVESAERDESITNAIHDQLFRWFLDHLRKAARDGEGYHQSPLLEHVFKVITTHSRTRERLFIFVTDGHFNVGEFYFSPINYASRKVTLDDLKRSVDAMKLKPFSISEANVSVAFYGLDHGDNEEFRQRQEEVLRWFLEPLPASRIDFHLNQ